jgi:hypothetical protein
VYEGDNEPAKLAFQTMMDGVHAKINQLYLKYMNEQ